MPILDPYGNPINTGALNRRQATPQAQTMGVRTLTSRNRIDIGLSPDKLAAALSSAENGSDPAAFFDLAARLEQKDLHYRGVLSTRKQAVTGLPITVEAVDDSAEAVRDADLAREILNSDAVRAALKDILDALGKGVSFSEILWDASEKQWRPRQVLWTDPRWFTFDPADLATPVLRESHTKTIRLKPGGWIVHQPKLISGLPITRGLAWAACWGWMLKSFALKDWAIFSECYGMPLRVGKYPAYLSEDDPAVLSLMGALSALGSDAAAAIPDSMVIEFVEAQRGGSGNNPFLQMADWVDSQIAYSVLGQTGTSAGTPGKLGNETAQHEVRRDIQRDDAADLAATLSRDLIRVAIDLNHGPRKAYPTISIPVEEPDDRAELADSLSKLIPLGLAVEASWVRDKWGIPDPAPDAELLGGVSPAPAAQRQSAHARQSIPEGTDIVDQQIGALERLQSAAMTDMIERIRREVMLAANLPDLQSRIERLYPELPKTSFVAVMTQALTAAQLAGRYELMEGF